MEDNTQNQTPESQSIPELPKRTSKTLSVISLIGGVAGSIVFIALLIGSFFQSFGVGLSIPSGIFYVVPFIGIFLVVIAIVAILKEKHRVFAITGLVFVVLWTIPSVVIGISNVVYDVSKSQTPSRVCDGVTGYCVTNSQNNAGLQVTRYTGWIKTALPYVVDWKVDTKLTAQACTVKDRTGDEWLKQISATTSKSQSTVVGDVRRALEERFEGSISFTFKETPIGFVIDDRDAAAPSFEDFRLVAVVQSGTIEITMNSGCFAPHPDKYQSTIDYDNNPIQK